MAAPAAAATVFAPVADACLSIWDVAVELARLMPVAVAQKVTFLSTGSRLLQVGVTEGGWVGGAANLSHVVKSVGHLLSMHLNGIAAGCIGIPHQGLVVGVPRVDLRTTRPRHHHAAGLFTGLSVGG